MTIQTTRGTGAPTTRTHRPPLRAAHEAAQARPGIERSRTVQQDTGGRMMKRHLILAALIAVVLTAVLVPAAAVRADQQSAGQADGPTGVEGTWLVTIPGPESWRGSAGGRRLRRRRRVPLFAGSDPPGRGGSAQLQQQRLRGVDEPRQPPVRLHHDGDRL